MRSWTETASERAILSKVGLQAQQNTDRWSYVMESRVGWIWCLASFQSR